MKIRNSFVANSSSSSFLICGVDRETFKEKYPECDGRWDLPDDMICVEDGEFYGIPVIYDDYGFTTDTALICDITNAREAMIKLGFDDTKFYYGVERG